MIQMKENEEHVLRRNELLVELQRSDLTHEQRLSLVGDVARLDAVIVSNIQGRLREVYASLEKVEKDVKKLTAGDLKRSYNKLYDEAKNGYREAMLIANNFSHLKKLMREHKKKMNEVESL